LLSREAVEEDIHEPMKRKRVLEHLVILGVEWDVQDIDGKNKFNKQELKAVWRFGGEKNVNDTGPTLDDGLVGSCMNGGNSTGAPGLSPAEDAKGEECRVLEVDDIDELLSNTQAEPDDELRAAEPSMEDCLLSIFKWADFDQIDDDEKAEEEVRTAQSLVRAGKKRGYFWLNMLREEASGWRKIDGFVIFREQKPSKN
jgi:hypothetical protein